MAKIIGFSGVANNGKTTLIESLCKHLIPHYSVAVIKHDPKSKAIIDIPHKDSARFYNSGANVAIISPTQTTIRFHEQKDIFDVYEMFNADSKIDYLFIEGYRGVKLPRICTIINDVDSSLVESANVIAIKNENIELLENLNLHSKKILNLDDIIGVLEWIEMQ